MPFTVRSEFLESNLTLFYLNEQVTSRKDQYQYWCRRDEPYRYVSVNDFVEAFKVFHVGNALGLELEVPFDRTKNHPAALTTSKFGISRMELLKACFSREWLLMKRNSFIYIIKVAQVRNMHFGS